MPKFYICSDIHGFYDEFREALGKSGFDENNPDHWLICCGDHWDRGLKPVEVMNYLMNLPRKVLIRGNHCGLFEECCKRGYPGSHDYGNGTFDTICELGGANGGRSFEECCVIAQQRAKPFFDSMVNYLETERYIFVHSWIPLINNDGLPAHYTRNRDFSFNPDWRYAHTYEWEDATWGNPFNLAENGLNQTGKIIVHGHFHNSYWWAKNGIGSEWGNDACFDVCEHNGCIGLDACTAHSHKCNILILEDNFLDKS